MGEGCNSLHPGFNYESVLLMALKSLNPGLMTLKTPFTQWIGTTIIKEL